MISKRTISWSKALVLLLLVGSAISVYFIVNRAFLEYAESLSFRRMTVTQLTDLGAFRFFYATNRVSTDSESPVEEGLKAELARTLDPSDPGQTEQASRLAGLLKPSDDKPILIDVTPVKRTRNFHSFSPETPEFFGDQFPTFTGTDLPKIRELYLLKIPEGAS